MNYEVIIDSRETANKCTIAPLSFRQDFRLIPTKGNGAIGPLSSSILLHHEGQCLTTIQKSAGEVVGIASIDCVWRRLNTLSRRISAPLPILAQIPNGFQTAYPRSSKQDTDPKNGLATIEAIFVATAILGIWDVSLLSYYYFGSRFVELNTKRFLDLGVYQNTLPVLKQRPRNSLQRRRDRGQLPEHRPTALKAPEN